MGKEFRQKNGNEYRFNAIARQGHDGNFKGMSYGGGRGGRGGRGSDRGGGFKGGRGRGGDRGFRGGRGSDRGGRGGWVDRGGRGGGRGGWVDRDGRGSDRGGSDRGGRAPGAFRDKKEKTIVFDREKRIEFVTGFKKRKDERRL